MATILSALAGLAFTSSLAFGALGDIHAAAYLMTSAFLCSIIGLIAR